MKKKKKKMKKKIIIYNIKIINLYIFNIKKNNTFILNIIKKIIIIKMSLCYCTVCHKNFECRINCVRKKHLCKRCTIIKKNRLPNYVFN